MITYTIFISGEQEGDENLLGFESKPTLQQKLNELKRNIAVIDEFSENIKNSDLNTTICKTQMLLTNISKLSKNLHAKLEFYFFDKEKHKRYISRNPDQEAKYRYALSFCNAKTHECDTVRKRCLALNKDLCKGLALCRGTQDSIPASGYVKMSDHNRVVRLLPVPYLEQFLDLEQRPDLIKQGSDMWHKQREKAVVTGSTLNNAIGLGKFTDQKLHHRTMYKGRKAAPPSDDVKMKLEYGKRNEPNALSTVIGLLVPSICAPCMNVVENGAMFLDAPNRQYFMEISADGSIQCSNPQSCPFKHLHVSGGKIILELKCPYPSDKFPHHPWYKVPTRIVPQLLAEMAVFGADELWLVSWTPISTTLFFVYFDRELWQKMWDLAVDFYGTDKNPLPSKRHPMSKELEGDVKQFVSTHTRFVVEVPSLTGEEGNLWLGSEHSPYAAKVELPLKDPDIDEIENLLKSCACEAKAVFSDAYNALREPASELLVYMLNCKDRIQQVGRIPNSVPVCYALKGDRMKMDKIRSLTEKCRDKLHSEGIDILCECYDGQFHCLMDKDINSKPLSKLQLARDTWNQVCKLGKDKLLQEMCKCNKIGIPDISKLNVVLSLPNGTYQFNNLIVEKSLGKLTLHTKGGKTFPESVADKFKYVHVNGDGHEPIRKEKLPKVVGLQEDERNLLSAIHPEFVSDLDNEGNTLERNEELTLYDTLAHEKVGLLQEILEDLREYNGLKWNDYTVEDLYVGVLQDANSLKKIKVDELKIIAKVMSRFTNGRIWYDTDQTKAPNVNIIARAFETETFVEEVRNTNTDRNKPSSLFHMCRKVIQSENYPTKSLQSSYANVLHIYNKRKWIEDCKVPMKYPVPFRDTEIEIFSYPEYSEKRKQLEPRTYDVTHILTNMRGHMTKFGYSFVKKEAFEAVCKHDNNLLSRSLVMDNVDCQNAFSAMQLISKPVEDCMRNLGFTETADFLFICRKWFESSNKRSISADERVAWFFDMHSFLLKDIDLDTFPPPWSGRYIKGMPMTTFEAILQNISTRIIMYKLAKGLHYNARAPTTLNCESFFSDLCRMDREFSIYPKAANISKMIGKVVMLNFFKHAPNKTFHLCTSNKASYPVHLALDDKERWQNESEESYDGTYRDSFFDFLDLHNSTRTRRIDITSGLVPMRCPTRLRNQYICDEQKILPERRAGLDILGTSDK